MVGGCAIIHRPKARRRFLRCNSPPPGKTTHWSYKVTKELAGEIGAKLNLTAAATPGVIFEKLIGLFPSLNAKGEVGGEAKATVDTTNENEIVIEAIDTPQRQLVQLVVHFLLNYTDRLFFVKDLAKEREWQMPPTILKVPREIVFIDFPSAYEADQQGRLPTRLIPMAVEVEGVGVLTMFDKIRGKREFPPEWPGHGTTSQALEVRKSYWNWFATNFDSIGAMQLVERTVAGGRILWIDYRVPMDAEGNTVHLHFDPGGDFDTGVFAFNLIERGFEHGLRIIGTVQSDPDINVLAVYEK